MPAQPSTMASARSSRIAAVISAEIFPSASVLRSSSASTGTSAARTRAQRSARPYFRKLCSIGTMETPSVVTTAKRAAIRLAMDEANAKLIAEKGIWLSTQPFLDLSGAAALGPAEQDKMRQVVAGTDRVYALAKKYKIKTAFGTDVLFSQALAEKQGSMLAALTRWYTPAEALAMLDIVGHHRQHVGDELEPVRHGPHRRERSGRSDGILGQGVQAITRMGLLGPYTFAGGRSRQLGVWDIHRLQKRPDHRRKLNRPVIRQPVACVRDHLMPCCLNSTAPGHRTYLASADRTFTN